MAYDRVLPRKWQEGLNARADLDAAFEALSCRGHHYFIDATRARLRTLQLRFDDARELFKTAFAAIPAIKTSEDHIRCVLLDAYRLELALLCGEDLTQDRFANSETRIDLDAGCPKRTEAPKEDGAFEAVDLFRCWHTKRLLYLGEPETAGRICGRALRETRSLNNVRLVDHFLNLSACQQNLGLDEAMEQSLENAGLAVCCLGSALGQAYGAASLYAHYAFLGDMTRARSWRFLLERLSCPSRTHERFIRRAEILIDRCKTRDRLLSF